MIVITNLVILMVRHEIKIKGQNKEKPDVEDDAEKDWMKLNDVIEEPVLADGCHYQSYSE